MEMWVPSIEATLNDGDVTVVKTTEGNGQILPGDEDMTMTTIVAMMVIPMNWIPMFG